MVSLTALTHTLDPALALLADVVQRPTFAPAEVERLRADHLTSLLQQRDVPGQVATDLLARSLYGSKQRYGQPLLGSEATLKALGQKDVIRWHKERLTPAQATVIVVGDVQPEAVVTRLAQAFRGWTGGHASKPLEPALPTTTRQVLLVDRPGAAQTELRIGQPSVERRSPDYFPLLVMNAILGGQFSSRLNLNLREKHGYTYGARSEIAFRRAGGPLVAGAPVKTAVTGPALKETLAELERIRAADVAPEELRLAKDMLKRQMARTFETAPEVAAALATLRVYGLPDDYYATYAAKVEAVAATDVRRVAQEHVDAKKMTLVLVGDAAQVAADAGVIAGAVRHVDALGEPASR
jgi:predicted Zn-dependent peptidase